MPSLAQDGVLLAALVDLDATIVVQLAIFLIFAVAFNALLVKPLVKVQNQRYGSMAGSRGDADAMNDKAADAFERYEKRLDEARKSAVSVRETLKAEGIVEAARLSAEVREQSEAQLARGLAEVAAQGAAARAELGAHADGLAQSIVARVLSNGNGNGNDGSRHGGHA